MTYAEKATFVFTCGGSASDWRPNLDNIGLIEVIGPSAGGRIGKSHLPLPFETRH
jgi:hypothetical protein